MNPPLAIKRTALFAVLILALVQYCDGQSKPFSSSIQSQRLSKPQEPQRSSGTESDWLLNCLAILVIAAVVVAALWWMRRWNPQTLSGPTDADLNVKGRQFLDAQTVLYTVQFGNKTLLIGKCEGAIATLAELSPQEHSQDNTTSEPISSQPSAPFIAKRPKPASLPA